MGQIQSKPQSCYFAGPLRFWSGPMGAFREPMAPMATAPRVAAAPGACFRLFLGTWIGQSGHGATIPAAATTEWSGFC